MRDTLLKASFYSILFWLILTSFTLGMDAKSSTRFQDIFLSEMTLPKFNIYIANISGSNLYIRAPKEIKYEIPATYSIYFSVSNPSYKNSSIKYIVSRKSNIAELSVTENGKNSVYRIDGQLCDNIFIFAKLVFDFKIGVNKQLEVVEELQPDGTTNIRIHNAAYSTGDEIASLQMLIDGKQRSITSRLYSTIALSEITDVCVADSVSLGVFYRLVSDCLSQVTVNNKSE